MDNYCHCKEHTIQLFYIQHKSLCILTRGGFVQYYYICKRMHGVHKKGDARWPYCNSTQARVLRMGGFLSSIADFVEEFFHILIVLVVVGLFLLFLCAIICVLSIPFCLYLKKNKRIENLYGGASAVVAQGPRVSAQFALNTSRTQEKEKEDANKKKFARAGLAVAEPETLFF